MPIIATIRPGRSGRGHKAILTTGGLYRESHPDYVEDNRSKQRARNAKRERYTIAETEVSIVEFPPRPGIYLIRLVCTRGIAKVGMCIVEISTYTSQSASSAEIAKTAGSSGGIRDDREDRILEQIA